MSERERERERDCVCVRERLCVIVVFLSFSIISDPNGRLKMFQGTEGILCKKYCDKSLKKCALNKFDFLVYLLFRFEYCI